MCLAIPMKIVDIEDLMARCEAKGVTREVSLFLLQDQALNPEDFVMVHVGFAIQTISRKDAESAWALFDEMLAYDA